MLHKFLLIAIFGLLGAAGYAELPVYECKLSAVISNQETEVGQCLKLDDGSAWIVKGYALGNAQHLKTWTKGDPVNLIWSMDNRLFIVFNLEQRGQPKVALDPQTLNRFPFITEVMEGGKRIKLSDHTLWKVTRKSRASTNKWEEGHHVFVQGDGSINNYSLTNLDLSEDLSKNKHAYAEFN